MTTDRLAAIYCRVSTERQSLEDKTSLDRQEKVCRRLAARLGLIVSEDYVIKEAHSASDPEDRPGLERLYIAAAQRQFQVVLMDVIDRTSRVDAYDLRSICKRFLDVEVTPMWAGHPDIDMTTKKGRLEAEKLAIKAAEDRETVVDRFQSGKTERIDEGKLIRSHIDYGYRWDAERPLAGDEDTREMWVPDEDGDPSPAGVVRRIFNYLADGWRTGGDQSANQMAYILQDADVPPPSERKRRPRKAARWGGKPARWQFAMVIYIVQNPSYKGKRPQNRWHKVPRTDDERKVFEERTGRKYTSGYKVVERPETEWVWTDVPALVDEQTWDDANKQVARNQTHNHRRPVRYTTADALLWGGHVRCGIDGCRSSMLVWRPTDTRGWYYDCKQTGQRDNHPSRTNRMLVRDVDAFVWSEAKRIIRDPDYLRSRLEQGKQQDVWSPEQQIAHYAGLIAECDANINGWNAEIAALGGDPLLASTRAHLVDLIKNKVLGRQEYVRKQDAARAEQVRQLEEHERLAEFQAKAQAAAPTLDDLDAEQRRRILLDLHVMVTVARRDDTRRPRLEVIFCLTSEAAAHAHGGEVWATWSTQTPQGMYVTFVEESWPPTAPDDDGLDFSGIPENALDNREASEYPTDEDDPGAENPSTLLQYSETSCTVSCRLSRWPLWVWA